MTRRGARIRRWISGKLAAQSAVDAAQKSSSRRFEKDPCGRRREAFEQKRAAHGFEDEAAIGLPNGRTRKSSGWIGKSGIFDEQKRTLAAQTHELEDKLSGRQRTDLTALQKPAGGGA